MVTGRVPCRERRDGRKGGGPLFGAPRPCSFGGRAAQDPQAHPFTRADHTPNTHTHNHHPSAPLRARARGPPPLRDPFLQPRPRPAQAVGNNKPSGFSLLPVRASGRSARRSARPPQRPPPRPAQHGGRVSGGGVRLLPASLVRPPTLHPGASALRRLRSERAGRPAVHLRQLPSRVVSAPARVRGHGGSPGHGGGGAIRAACAGDRATDGERWRGERPSRRVIMLFAPPFRASAARSPSVGDAEGSSAR